MCKNQSEGVGAPNGLSLGAGASGVVGVGMFVVVVSVVVVVSAPLGGSPRGVARPTRLGRLAGPASLLAGRPAG